MTESETGGPELYFPALGGGYEKLTPYTWPLVRVTVGLMLVPHGWMKLIGGGLEGTARFMAQIGLEPAYPLALGLFTRPIAVLVVGFMAVSAYYVHAANGFLWIKGGFEYPLFWGFVALAIAVRGGGPKSLDARMKRQF